MFVFWQMAGMHPPKGWPPQKEFNSCGCPTEILGLKQFNQV